MIRSAARSNDTRPARPFARRRSRLAGPTILGLLVALCGAVLAMPACDRPAPGDRSKAREKETVAPPATPPQYTFAAGVRDAQPEVAAFVRTFLETCLAGDYTGYRKLVSRAREPESKERFQTVYYAIRTVIVESIEPIELRDVPRPTYLVISALDFDPDRKVALRGGKSRIAMLVFREEGDWRMVPAPSELQPQETAATATSSAPADTQPAAAYPWDEDGDY